MTQYYFDALLTEEEGGAYSVEFPSLRGCFTCGDDFNDAVLMAVDAARTWVASAMRNGEEVPGYMSFERDGSKTVCVTFETDPSWIVDGPVVSAAEAARQLGVSPSRITHMLDAGQLSGYRSGRRTFVAKSSVDARKASPAKPGRPKTSRPAISNA